MGTRTAGYDAFKRAAGESLLSHFNEYANNRTLLTFQCATDDCSNEFNTTSFLYQNSNTRKFCSTCRDRNSSGEESYRSTFLDKCRARHGDYYDYSLIPHNFDLRDNITVICPKHGQFEIPADQHKHVGCSVCKTERISEMNRSSKTEFTVKANTVHKFKYRYDGVDYQNAKQKVTITCPKHGNFEQSPDSHLRGSGCTICTSTSKPVEQILEILSSNGVVYSLEKTFNGCIGVKGKLLRFDIFIPEYNLCIEYDGIQHFQPTKFTSAVTDKQATAFLEVQQENDRIKDAYCETNNINFIRIPYTEFQPADVVWEYITTNHKPERTIHTWDDFGEDVRNICNYINSFNYDNFAIYGISRGGLPHAVHVSNHYESQSEFGVVNFQRYDGNSKTVELSILHETADLPIFIIDDLISSGETMNKVMKKLQHKFNKATLHPIVIYGDENENGVFWLRDHPKQWIVFPYEV